MKTYYYSKTWGAGHGGMKCPCCTRASSVKETRTRINRDHRRKFRQGIDALIADAVEETADL